jgi:hypothetical protein
MISLFNLLFIHIFQIFPLFSLPTYCSHIFFVSFHFST